MADIGKLAKKGIVRQGLARIRVDINWSYFQNTKAPLKISMGPPHSMPQRGASGAGESNVGDLAWPPE